MKKSKKKTILIIFLTILIVGLGSFLFVKLEMPRRIALLHPTEDTVRRDVKKYLRDRYEEEFVVTNILPPGFNYASYIITAYPENAPQKAEYKVTIHGWKDKGLIDYYDNYPVVKLKPELMEYMSDVVDEFFPEHRVYIQNFHKEWIRENIDKGLTLDEFLNDIEGDWHSSGWYHICIPYDNWDDQELLNQINKMIACMAKNNLSGFFYVEIIYRNFDTLSDDYDKLDFGKHDRDYVNYSYVIGRNGEFDEETEVKTHGIK